MMKSILFAVLTSVCWGIAPFFEKEGLKKADPFMVTLIRCSMLFLVSFFCLFWNKKLICLVETDFKSLIFIVLGGIFSHRTDYLFLCFKVWWILAGNSCCSFVSFDYCCCFAYFFRDEDKFWSIFRYALNYLGNFLFALKGMLY